LFAGACALVLARPAVPSCGREPYLVIPEDGGEVPLNAHVWIDCALRKWQTTDFEHFEEKLTPAFSFELQPLAADGRAGKALTADTRVHDAVGKTLLIELVPAAPLPAKTHFRVVRHDATASHPDEILGTFATGSAVQEQPPGQPSLSPFRLTDLGIWAPITVTARDSERIRFFFIWAAEPGHAIDYATPPLVVAQGTTTLRLNPTFCSSGLDALLPKAPRWKLGVEAADIAGNLSPPREIIVQNPRRQPR
jgi:hypothetical protein